MFVWNFLTLDGQHGHVYAGAVQAVKVVDTALVARLQALRDNHSPAQAATV